MKRERLVKVRSSLTEPEDERNLKAKYEEIYTKSDAWLRWKFHGVHTVTATQIRDLLPGARVLDLGCGPGRLALMCATLARHVDGLDFSKEAIHLAQLNAKACRLPNASFFVADLDEYQNPRAYEIVILTGVLEHVKSPLGSLARLNSLLVDGGVAVVSCPNFCNFRGYTYMTLRTLFDLPMSLADLRQVSYNDILGWSQQAGFALTKTVGAIYRWGWKRRLLPIW